MQGENLVCGGGGKWQLLEVGVGEVQDVAGS